MEEGQTYYRPRPWVEKFENGEYLRQWKNYEPVLIGGAYSDPMNIGEEKFQHCIGAFYGIGDVDWWESAELNKLTSEELKELEYICAYKTYLKNAVTHEIIKQLSLFFGCETFHIYRIGKKEIIELLKQMNSFRNKVLKGSQGCLDPKTIEYKEKENVFDILSFEEFKSL